MEIYAFLSSIPLLMTLKVENFHVNGGTPLKMLGNQKGFLIKNLIRQLSNLWEKKKPNVGVPIAAKLAILKEKHFHLII